MQTVVTHYRDLARWDVKSFLLFSNIGADHVRLGILLRKKQNQWNGTDDAPMLSLHFGGEFSQRESNQIKGQLFVADKGDLVYSKIDLRNGAIGIIPSQYSQALFTAEFPIYEIDTNVIHPVYLQLYLQSSAFKNLINSIVSGASGRKRVKPTDFENLYIHVPAMKIQEGIVNDWNKAQMDVQGLRKAADELESNIDDFILNELGITKQNYKKIRGAFVVRFKDLERWDLSFIQKKSDQFSKAKFKASRLKDITLDIFQGVGKKEGVNAKYILLKVKNILLSGEIDYINIETLQGCPERKLLHKGDIISPFIGETIRLNKFAVFNAEPAKYSVDNNTGVIRINQLLADPEYVRICLASTIGKDQIDSILIGGSVPFLGKTNAENLKIVLPPLPVQRLIIEKVNKMTSAVKKMRKDATDKLQSAKADIEKALI